MPVTVGAEKLLHGILRDVGVLVELVKDVLRNLCLPKSTQFSEKNSNKIENKIAANEPRGAYWGVDVLPKRSNLIWNQSYTSRWIAWYLSQISLGVRPS